MSSSRDDAALGETEVAEGRPSDGGVRPSWVGAVIDGRYEIDGVLGSGAMGVVYRAHEPILGRQVALKTIAGAWTDDDAFAARFHHEARALARIRHPNVVQLYTFGIHDGAWFLAMELVVGASLAKVIDLHAERGARISPHNALILLQQVLAGAAAIHAAGLVHCDLKPANIVVERDSGRPVIVDFGVVAEARHARQGSLGGSPGYMAPEQEVSSSPHPAMDVYALGCTAYELLTGQLLYGHASTVEELFRLHREAPVPRLSEAMPDLAAFDDWMARALAKDPDDRFANGREMQEALDEAYACWCDRIPTPPSAPPGEETPYILVVDDDPGFLRAVARATRLACPAARMRIVPVASGEDALRYAIRQLPRLVLLDYMLPRLDGVATLSVLRSLPGGHDVRVVVISGAVEDVRWQFVALGVRHFVAKPADLDTLVEALSTVVGD